jgi:hypothetical protein
MLAPEPQELVRQIILLGRRSNCAGHPVGQSPPDFRPLNDATLGLYFRFLGQPRGF